MPSQDVRARLWNYHGCHDVHGARIIHNLKNDLS